MTTLILLLAMHSPLPFNHHLRFQPGVYYAGAGTYVRLARDGTASVDDVWLSGPGSHTGTWRERRKVIEVRQYGKVWEFWKEDLRRRE
jgi:hypothetical protein